MRLHCLSKSGSRPVQEYPVTSQGVINGAWTLAAAISYSGK